MIACAPEQSHCCHCGEPTTVIGYEQSEQLDVEPAKYFVLVTKREKRACRHCEQGGVSTAPAPARIIEKSLVSDRVVIDTVIAKYSDHLPLYRQSVMLERETGLEISRATLDGWVMTVGELLIPLAAVMRRELVGGTYIQADETPVDVQMHDRRGKNHQAYLWQYGRPGGSVVFDFQLGRGRDGPKKFLAGFNGILQTDGYVAYDKVGGPKMVHAACWRHSRRKFYEAHQVCPGESVAKGIVQALRAQFGRQVRRRGVRAAAPEQHRVALLVAGDETLGDHQLQSLELRIERAIRCEAAHRRQQARAHRPGLALGVQHGARIAPRGPEPAAGEEAGAEVRRHQLAARHDARAGALADVAHQRHPGGDLAHLREQPLDLLPDAARRARRRAAGAAPR